MTVTGKTVGENIAHCPVLNYNVIKPIDAPYRDRGGLAILRGNLAPLGAVVKESAVAPEMLAHSGPAVVFNSEEEASAAIWAKKIEKGDIIVIRYEGPKGGPGIERCSRRPPPSRAWVSTKTSRLSQTADSPAPPAALPSAMFLRKRWLVV